MPLVFCWEEAEKDKAFEYLDSLHLGTDPINDTSHVVYDAYMRDIHHDRYKGEDGSAILEILPREERGKRRVKVHFLDEPREVLEDKIKEKIISHHNKECDSLIYLLLVEIAKGNNVLEQEEVFKQINSVSWRTANEISVSYVSRLLENNHNGLIVLSRVNSYVTDNLYNFEDYPIRSYGSIHAYIESFEGVRIGVRPSSANAYVFEIREGTSLDAVLFEVFPEDNKERLKEQLAISQEKWLAQMVETIENRGNAYKKTTEERIKDWQREYTSAANKLNTAYNKIVEDTRLLAVLKTRPPVTEDDVRATIKDIRGLSPVEDVSLNHNGIVVRTRNLFCKGTGLEKGTVETKLIGQIKITIPSMAREQLKFTNLTHPNLRAGCHFGDFFHGACYGSGETTVVSLLAEEDYANLVTYLINFIESPPGDDYGRENFDDFPTITDEDDI